MRALPAVSLTSEIFRGAELHVGCPIASASGFRHSSSHWLTAKFDVLRSNRLVKPKAEGAFDAVGGLTKSTFFNHAGATFT